VTGAVALMLQRNPALTPTLAAFGLRAYFAVSDGATGNAPNNSWGWGKLFRAADSDDDGLINWLEDVNLNFLVDSGETDPSNSDSDFDGLPDGTDNCPLTPNPPQDDSDGDGRGEGCDPCTNAGGGQDMTGARKAILRAIGASGVAGDDRLVIKGEFDLAAGTSFAMLDPLVDGARILLESQNGTTEADVTLPGGAWGGPGSLGWRSRGNPVEKWIFLDGTAVPASGIKKMIVKKRTGVSGDRVLVRAIGKTGSYPIDADDAPLTAIVVLGGSQAAADQGLCGEAVFAPGDCVFKAAGDNLLCRAP
jgi:hypothetical protein